jgi:predicted AlkP superfamily phosphohydrolase/phosphomutase
MTHFHLIDSWAHRFWASCDSESPLYNAEESDEAQQRKIQSYKIADSFVGELMKLTDEKTLIIIVSDHGATSCHTSVNLNRLLMEKDLLTLRQSGRELVVDWTKTKAFVQPDVADTPIYINLRDRDPEGIVEKGEEYENVREEIIDSLYELKDPRNKVYPIAFAAKREDASAFGVYGDRVGDVFFAYKPGYATNNNLADTELFRFKFGVGTRHGPYLSTFRDLHGVLLMAGPGVKRGLRYDKMACIIDVAPTIAYLLDLPSPRNADGKILRTALIN